MVASDSSAAGDDAFKRSKPNALDETLTGGIVPESMEHADEDSAFGDALPSIPGKTPALPSDQADPRQLNAGAVLLDFQIQQVMGRGAFGTVYQAIQLSLNRPVALKVTQNVGDEGRTMACLEHPNIVQVFSETVFGNGRYRLLCMQLVTGPTLQTARQALADRGLAAGWSGAEFLSVIDELCVGIPTFEPAQLESRSQLQNADFPMALITLMTGLLDGLSCAHHAKVLHRDIKPANILLNPFGQGLLADFNLSLRDAGANGGEALFGGTLAYMAPEHLNAMVDLSDEAADAVDERSDLCSMGLVLAELLTGHLPPQLARMAEQTVVTDDSAPGPQNTASRLLGLRSRGPVRADDVLDCLPSGARQAVDQTADDVNDRSGMLLSEGRSLRAPPEKVAGLASDLTGNDRLPADSIRTLAAQVERSTNPDPGRRHVSAAEFCEAMRGCRRMREAESRRAGSTTSRQQQFRERARLRPMLFLLLLAVLPHAVGSVVNITYNALRLGDDKAVAADAEILPAPTVDSETAATKAKSEFRRMFHSLIAIYNVAIWPICLTLVGWLVWPAIAAIRDRADGDREQLTRQRRLLIRLPLRLAAVGAIGWFSGLVFFPVGLALRMDAVPWRVVFDLEANLLLSGMIALTYSSVGTCWLIITVLYPRYWWFAEDFTAPRVDREVAVLAGPLKLAGIMASLIPLAAVVAVVMVGPERFTTGFRLLVVALLVGGSVGNFKVKDVLSRLAAR